MLALEVTRNGKRVCVACIGDYGVIDAHVHWYVRDGRVTHPQLAVGGLEGATKMHLSWLSRAIRLGDVITIRAVEVVNSDAPKRRYRLLGPGEQPAKATERSNRRNQRKTT